MAIEVAAATAVVVTVKVTLAAPAGTITLACVRAAGLLLDKRTCAPPEGAAALRVTVPVGDFVAPTTLVGLSDSEVRVGNDGGCTMSTAVKVTPL